MSVHAEAYVGIVEGVLLVVGKAKVLFVVNTEPVLLDRCKELDIVGAVSLEIEGWFDIKFDPKDDDPLGRR